MKKSVLIIFITLLISQLLVAQEEKSPGFLMQRAFNRIQTKDYEGALKDYNEALKLNANNAAAYVSRGTLYALYINDFKAAFADFDKAIELDPKMGGAYYNRAELKVNLKDYKGALSDFDQAAELSPNLASIFYKRGNLKFANLNDKAGACVDWKKAKELGDAKAGDALDKMCK